MGILAWQRALATLAVFGLWQASIRPQLVGINDYSPGLLILIAMLVLRSRPLVGAIVLSVAAALKPYAVGLVPPRHRLRRLGRGRGAGRGDGGAVESAAVVGRASRVPRIGPPRRGGPPWSSGMP